MSSKILKNIDIDLSQSSLQNAIREVNRMKGQLRDSLAELAEMLTMEGVDVAKMQVVALDAVRTGDLENSIYGYYDRKTHIGFVFAPSPYAFYVEYGTGIVAMTAPHPEQGLRGIQYDQNGHGLEGWWYPSEDGWYVTKSGERLAWTKGMPARPFMYNTMKWLEEAARTMGSQIWTEM